MPYTFGDGFDLYTAGTDVGGNYYDGGSGFAFFVPVAGRFTGSRAAQLNNAASAFKNSGVNEFVHHITVAFRQTAALSGTVNGGYLMLGDGATGQCAICFRSDGTIQLRSGTAAGAVLATYSGAVAASSTWYAFEFEVVIHNSTGSFKVRRDGNTSDDHSTTGIDTAGGTANNYASRLTIGMTTIVSTQAIDDLFWRSHSTTLSWLGDLCCRTRYPADDFDVDFTPYGPIVEPIAVNASPTSRAANVVLYTPFVATWTGTIDAATLFISTTVTGHFKVAIYDETRTTVLGTSSEFTNAISTSGSQVTFAAPVAVTAGTNYFLATCQDVTTNYQAAANTQSVYVGSTTYASFPATSPSITGPGGTPIVALLTFTPAGALKNADRVNELQTDSFTSYNYSGTVAARDWHGIVLDEIPLTIHAVTTRATMMKSDAGTRFGAAYMSVGDIVGSQYPGNSLALINTAWRWSFRTDPVNPDTGAAWTAAEVASIYIGVEVSS